MCIVYWAILDYTPCGCRKPLISRICTTTIKYIVRQKYPTNRARSSFLFGPIKQDSSISCVQCVVLQILLTQKVKPFIRKYAKQLLMRESAVRGNLHSTTKWARLSPKEVEPGRQVDNYGTVQLYCTTTVLSRTNLHEGTIALQKRPRFVAETRLEGTSKRYYTKTHFYGIIPTESKCTMRRDHIDTDAHQLPPERYPLAIRPLGANYEGCSLSRGRDESCQ